MQALKIFTGMTRSGHAGFRERIMSLSLGRTCLWRRKICPTSAYFFRTKSSNSGKGSKVATTSTKGELSTQPKDYIGVQIYKGEMSNSMLYFRIGSYASGAASIVLAGVAVKFADFEGQPFWNNLVIPYISFIFGTTSWSLNWVANVYVNKLYFDPESKHFTFEHVDRYGRTLLSRHYIGHIDVLEQGVDKGAKFFPLLKAEGRRYYLNPKMEEFDKIIKAIYEYNKKRDALLNLIRDKQSENFESEGEHLNLKEMNLKEKLLNKP